jgi:hypothetical protein
LEDSLDASNKAEAEHNKQEGIAATRNLAKLVVSAMLKARGESANLLREMEELEIDPDSSALGQMVALCATELNIPATSITASQQPDIASLVSAVGSAQQGPAREEAVNALKQYKETYGDSELNNHLEDVSAAFRAFILDQLSEIPRPLSPKNSNNSMSERIKNLRSKLNATEAVIQSTVISNPQSSSQTKPVSQQDEINSGASTASGSLVSSKECQVALPKPSVKAFRDRLAAAQEKRIDAPDVLSPPAQTTAGSRAAALRARLQAVKMQTKLIDEK